MPKTAVLRGREFNCPGCGALNKVIYGGCTECDKEVEFVDATQKETSSSSSNSPNDEIAWLTKLHDIARKRGNDISLKWLYKAISDRTAHLKKGA